MYKESFPLLKKGTYLNTAYVGPMSKELAKFRRDQESIYFNNVEAYKASGKKLIEETHTTLARFYGSKPKNTYVIPNFSVGIRQVISLIPKKMKVLILDGDYPSLTSAFTESYHEVIKIPLQPEIEAAIEKQFQTNEINILALSIVQYATGLLIDFDFLKTLKENYPNLILIGDGTQFLGAHVFNFESSPFDVVAASGYKWMLAGFGNGVLMRCNNQKSSERREKLNSEYSSGVTIGKSMRSAQ